MATSKEIGGCKEDHLHYALEDIRYGKCSFRKAETKYGIPKSTLNDYATGKVGLGKRRRPTPVLKKDEEQYLSSVGY